jgi:hypothetical protein
MTRQELERLKREQTEIRSLFCEVQFGSTWATELAEDKCENSVCVLRSAAQLSPGNAAFPGTTSGKIRQAILDLCPNWCALAFLLTALPGRLGEKSTAGTSLCWQRVQMRDRWLAGNSEKASAFGGTMDSFRHACFTVGAFSPGRMNAIVLPVRLPAFLPVLERSGLVLMAVTRGQGVA